MTAIGGQICGCITCSTSLCCSCQMPTRVPRRPSQSSGESRTPRTLCGNEAQNPAAKAGRGVCCVVRLSNIKPHPCKSWRPHLVGADSARLHPTRRCASTQGTQSLPCCHAGVEGGDACELPTLVRSIHKQRQGGVDMAYGEAHDDDDARQHITLDRQSTSGTDMDDEA